MPQNNPRLCAEPITSGSAGIRLSRQAETGMRNPPGFTGSQDPTTGATMTDRVLLTLDDQVISAKYFSYVFDETGDCCGVRVAAENEESAYYVVEGNPTCADYYEIAVADDATYDEKKRAILAATGWTLEEEFDWLETDEQGEVVPGTDTDATITQWLRRPLMEFGGEPYIDFYFSYGSRTSTQYTPGFIILDSLPADEREALQIRESDLGGPASSVPCVSTKASIHELNWALKRNGLPFVFVDAEGSDER